MAVGSDTACLTEHLTLFMTVSFKEKVSLEMAVARGPIINCLLWAHTLSFHEKVSLVIVDGTSKHLTLFK